jgi:hypothetical protein
VPVNSDKVHIWKKDVMLSVDFYNNWFMEFAPSAFRKTRIETTKQVKRALEWTSNLTDVCQDVLIKNPNVLPMLRMSTCPPIARDRLIGLAGVSPNLIKKMETENVLPPRMKKTALMADLEKIGNIIEKMADKDIFTWLDSNSNPEEKEVYRASTIVADRLCGAVADPIIRNAQEQRQLAAIAAWLEKRGYLPVAVGEGITFETMEPGTFSFRMNIPVALEGGERQVNIPVDAVIQPLNSQKGDFPLLFEAKSAGDFTNTNKRRKEEAIKMMQLRSTYGKDVQFILFLCGYFDSGYLGYEAAEGIDWVWEHRIDDMSQFGL